MSTWWNDRDIQVVGIDGKEYALYGWNGEKYTECWEVVGLDAIGKYEIEPIMEEQDGDFEIVGYKVI